MSTHPLNNPEEPSAKRVRINEDASAYVTTGSYSANSSSSSSSNTLAPPNSSSSNSIAGPAPLAVPLSPLLTHNPPGWISEVPSFLEGVQEHEPTIPDEVVQYLLERSGCNTSDPKLIRLVGIATQHFLDDVMHDAKQFHKLRSKDKANTELTLPDLSSALEAHGITLSKPDYYADNVFAGGMVNVRAAVEAPQSNVQATAPKAETKKNKK